MLSAFSRRFSRGSCRWLAPLAVVAMGGVACSSQGTPSDAHVLGDSSVIGKVVDIARTPLTDATVCVFGRATGCVTTDERGNYVLEDVADGADVLVSLEHEGFVRGLRMLQTGEAERIDLGATLLPSVDAVSMQRERLGIDAVAGTGMIGFFAIDTVSLLPVVHVRARVSPLQGDGPYYFNADGEIDPVLTFGTDAAGYFYNLPVNDYAVTVTQPDLDPPTVCDGELPGRGWGVDSYGGHRVPVVADAITFVVPVCLGAAARP